jgi:threonine/homoserine/homoserine lactone efflux protein
VIFIPKRRNTRSVIIRKPDGKLKIIRNHFTKELYLPEKHMHVHNFFLFLSASFLLCIVPGPDMIFLLSRSIAQGRRAGIAAAVGINAGAYVHLAAVILGLSGLLAASAVAFTVLKWIGACYLVYIGIQALRSRSGVLDIPNASSSYSLKQIFWQGFLSDVLNPKVAIFYLAFLPQFIDENASDRSSQLLMLGTTLNVMAILINLSLVYFASLFTQQIRSNAKISLWLNKVMGGIFVLLGIKLATDKI